MRLLRGILHIDDIQELQSVNGGIAIKEIKLQLMRINNKSHYYCNYHKWILLRLYGTITGFNIVSVITSVSVNEVAGFTTHVCNALLTAYRCSK